MKKQRETVENRLTEEKRKKAAVIAQAKSRLAKKLQDAQERTRKEILAEEARQEARKLAKEQAASLAA